MLVTAKIVATLVFLHIVGLLATIFMFVIV